MKIKKSLLALLLSLFLVTGCESRHDKPSNPSSEDPSTTNSSEDPTGYDNPEEGNGVNDPSLGNYYDGIDESLTGTELLNKLHDLNSSKRNKTVGYKNMWDYYGKTDGSGGKYYAFYDGTLTSKGDMNKEHVWPESRGGGLVDGDIHMPRPTISADNSSRGNSFYVEGMNHSANGWDPYTAATKNKENAKMYRGASARIIFYCAIANTSLTLVDRNNDSLGNHTMGKLSDLLKWNLEEPVYRVDSVTHEIQRNRVIEESVQGNRNPFIDHPEYACKIWGDTNSATKAICAKANQPNEDVEPEVTSVSITSGNATLKVGDEKTFTANVEGKGKIDTSVTFSLEDVNPSGCVTLTGNKVKAVKVGTAKLVATSKQDNTKSDSVIITVKEKVAGEKENQIEEFYDNFEEGKNVTVVGKLLGTGNNGAFIGSGDRAVFTFFGQNTSAVGSAKAGDFVEVKGNAKTFNGCQQISLDRNSSLKVVTNSKVADYVGDLTLSKVGDLSRYNISRSVVVTGKVSGYSEKPSSKNDYHKISFSVALSDGNSVKVYAEDRKISADDYASLKNVKDGDNVTVKGYLGYYNGENNTPTYDDITCFQIIVPHATVNK